MFPTYGRSIISVAEENLRCRVGQTAAASHQFGPGVELVGESEVRELHHAELLEEHDVFRLEIPVDNV